MAKSIRNIIAGKSKGGRCQTMTRVAMVIATALQVPIPYQIPFKVQCSGETKLDIIDLNDVVSQKATAG